MLALVEAWVPPSGEHVNLKTFMAEQITESLQFDCGGDYHESAIAALEPQAATVWRSQVIASLNETISRASKSLAADKLRANELALWVRQLKQSLVKK